MGSNVAERIENVIVDQLGVDCEEVTPDATFVHDLGADSLDQVEIIMAVEEEFGIEIPDDDAERLTTVAEATAYVERRLAEKRATQ